MEVDDELFGVSGTDKVALAAIAQDNALGLDVGALAMVEVHLVEARG